MMLNLTKRSYDQSYMTLFSDHYEVIAPQSISSIIDLALIPQVPTKVTTMSLKERFST